MQDQIKVPKPGKARKVKGGKGKGKRDLGPETTAPPGVACNFCGSAQFVDHKGRGPYRCAKCSSFERTRILYMYVQRFVELRPGMKVLHFAPERQLFPIIAEAVGEGYEVRDIQPERFGKLEAGETRLQRFDLCADSAALPDAQYDLILHNHVMEHLPCNLTAVLWHLHRALKPDGLHVFSVPVGAGHYEEAIGPMGRDERVKRFGHPQHMRSFGLKDLRATLGMVFDIDATLERSLIDLFGAEALTAANIAESRWRGFNGANLFLLRKHDLKLRGA